MEHSEGRRRMAAGGGEVEQKEEMGLGVGRETVSS